MDCKLIIANSIDKYISQRTSYISNFKSQAQIENRYNYVEFSDFFDGCKYIISLYKKEIEGQIRKDINDEISEHNNRRRMLEIDKNIDSGEDFEYELLKKKKENIVVFLSDKHADNSQYKCCIRSDNGEMVENSFTGHLIPYNDDHTALKYCIFDLTYLDVLLIEKELTYAQETFIENKKLKRKLEIKTARKINIDNLYPYFTSNFKGKGNGNIDNFSRLVDELKTDRTALEFTQIAHLIFKSKFFNKREFKSFSKWLKFFCAQTGVKYVNYKPNRVKNPSDSLLKIFNYLLL